MKRILNLLMAGVLLVACSENSLNVTIQNPSDFDRIQELVEIPVSDLNAKFKPAGGETYLVKNAAGDIVSSQITYDGKLIFQAGVNAGETISYNIVTGEAQEYTTKTYGRFIPERLDDYGWENDRVAFRIYGAALIEKDGPSNGIDAFYKRTENMVIDKWMKDYVENRTSYHIDRGEGMDDYKVGRSLGLGAMAPFVNGKLWLNENFIANETFENGPLRTTFKVTYKDLDVDGINVTETRTFSIDAGSQLTKITQEYGVSEAIEVAAGISKRENDDFIAADNYIIYQEDEHESNGDIYLGVVFPDGIKNTLVDTYAIQLESIKNRGQEVKYSHILAVSDYQPGQPFTYYAGFGWSKWGFENRDVFVDYVEKFLAAQKQPLVVKY